MLILKDFPMCGPRSEALIKLYRSGKIVLNAATAKLLRLDDSSRITFRTDSESRNVYVGKREYKSSALRPYGREYVLNFSSLCRDLADKLEGYGTYRVEAESKEIDQAGNTYYRIFNKKFEK